MASSETSSDLKPPASVTRTEAFSQAVATRSSAFAPAARAARREIGSLGRSADAWAQALAARSDVSMVRFSPEWILALLKRYQGRLWSLDTPNLHYFRLLRRPKPDEEETRHGTSYSSPAFARAAAPRAASPAHFARPLQPSGEKIIWRDRDSNAGVRSPLPAPERRLLSAATLPATRPLPVMLHLHRGLAHPGPAAWTDPAKMRIVFPEALASAVAQRIAPPRNRSAASVPFREAASLPMPLSYPPVPLASWLGEAAPAPEQAYLEHITVYSRPQLRSAASHLLVLPKMTASPIPETAFGSPANAAFASLPQMATARSRQQAQKALSEAFMTVRTAAGRPTRPPLERRVLPGIPGMQNVAETPAETQEREPASDAGEGHPAAQRSVLRAAQSALDVLSRAIFREASALNTFLPHFAMSSPHRDNAVSRLASAPSLLTLPRLRRNETPRERVPDFLVSPPAVPIRPESGAGRVPTSATPSAVEHRPTPTGLTERILLRTAVLPTRPTPLPASEADVPGTTAQYAPVPRLADSAVWGDTGETAPPALTQRLSDLSTTIRARALSLVRLILGPSKQRSEELPDGNPAVSPDSWVSAVLTGTRMAAGRPMPLPHRRAEQARAERLSGPISSFIQPSNLGVQNPDTRARHLDAVRVGLQHVPVSPATVERPLPLGEFLSGLPGPQIHLLLRTAVLPTRPTPSPASEADVPGPTAQYAPVPLEWLAPDQRVLRDLSAIRRDGAIRESRLNFQTRPASHFVERDSDQPLMALPVAAERTHIEASTASYGPLVGAILERYPSADSPPGPQKTLWQIPVNLPQTPRQYANVFAFAAPLLRLLRLGDLRTALADHPLETQRSVQTQTAPFIPAAASGQTERAEEHGVSVASVVSRPLVSFADSARRQILTAQAEEASASSQAGLTTFLPLLGELQKAIRFTAGLPDAVSVWGPDTRITGFLRLTEAGKLWEIPAHRLFSRLPDTIRRLTATLARASTKERDSTRVTGPARPTQSLWTGVTSTPSPTPASPTRQSPIRQPLMPSLATALFQRQTPDETEQAWPLSWPEALRHGRQEATAAPQFRSNGLRLPDFFRRREWRRTETRTSSGPETYNTTDGQERPGLTQLLGGVPRLLPILTDRRPDSRKASVQSRPILSEFREWKTFRANRLPILGRLLPEKQSDAPQTIGNIPATGEQVHVGSSGRRDWWSTPVGHLPILDSLRHRRQTYPQETWDVIPAIKEQAHLSLPEIRGQGIDAGDRLPLLGHLGLPRPGALRETESERFQGFPSLPLEYSLFGERSRAPGLLMRFLTRPSQNAGVVRDRQHRFNEQPRVASPGLHGQETVSVSRLSALEGLRQRLQAYSRQAASVAPLIEHAGLQGMDAEQIQLHPVLSLVRSIFGKHLPLSGSLMRLMSRPRRDRDEIQDGISRPAAPLSFLADLSSLRQRPETPLRPTGGRVVPAVMSSLRSWNETEFEDEAAAERIYGDAISEVASRSFQAQIFAPLRDFLLTTLARLMPDEAQTMPSWQAFPQAMNAGDIQGLQLSPPMVALPRVSPTIFEEGMGRQRHLALTAGSGDWSIRLIQGQRGDGLQEEERTERRSVAVRHQMVSVPRPTNTPLLTRSMAGQTGPLRGPVTGPQVTGRDLGESGGWESSTSLLAATMEQLLVQSNRRGTKDLALPRRVRDVLRGREGVDQEDVGHTLIARPGLPSLGTSQHLPGRLSTMATGRVSPLAERVPQMPLPGRHPQTMSADAGGMQDPFLIQRAVSGGVAASPSQGSPGSGNSEDESASHPGKGKQGADTKDLANEVWSLLKRKIAQESARSGH